MRTVIGIDPGLSGGICVMEDSIIKALHKMPVRPTGKKGGSEVDGTALAYLLVDFAGRDDVLIVVEKVHAMPKQGVSSTFTFGEGCGVIRGVLETLCLPRNYTTPQQWVKVVLEGTPKGDKTTRGFRVAQGLWPNAPFIPEGCKKPHMGLVDAALIAEYGRRCL